MRTQTGEESGSLLELSGISRGNYEPGPADAFLGPVVTPGLLFCLFAPTEPSLLLGEESEGPIFAYF